MDVWCRSTYSLLGENRVGIVTRLRRKRDWYNQSCINMCYLELSSSRHPFWPYKNRVSWPRVSDDEKGGWIHFGHWSILSRTNRAQKKLSGFILPAFAEGIQENWMIGQQHKLWFSFRMARGWLGNHVDEPTNESHSITLLFSFPKRKNVMTNDISPFMIFFPISSW